MWNHQSPQTYKRVFFGCISRRFKHNHNEPYRHWHQDGGWHALSIVTHATAWRQELQLHTSRHQGQPLQFRAKSPCSHVIMLNNSHPHSTAVMLNNSHPHSTAVMLNNLHPPNNSHPHSTAVMLNNSLNSHDAEQLTSSLSSRDPEQLTPSLSNHFF